MNNYEEETINKFCFLCFEYYIELLRNTNAVDFNVFCDLKMEDIPFKIYNDIASDIISELESNDNAEYYLSTILKDAYLYTYFHNDNHTEIIRGTIENNNISSIAYVMATDGLLCTAIVKAFINYLSLIKENIAYKDLLIDEVTKNKKEDLLSKFDIEFCDIKTRNYCLRAVLMDKFYALKECGTDDNEVFNFFDMYFAKEAFIDTDESEYKNVLNGTTINEIINEQVRLVYETVYMALLDKNTYDKKTRDCIISYISSHAQDEYLTLPEEKDIRWAFYQIFIDNCFNTDTFTSIINKNDQKILSKIYPSYILDLIST